MSDPQRALLESEDRYRAFFEHSFDAVLITSPEGSILEANPAACAMFGYDEDELRALGREGVVDVHDPRLHRMLEERSATGRTRGELTMKRKDGRRFEAELSSAAYEGPNGEARTSMMVRDLTERKRAEREAEAERNRLRELVEQAPVLMATAEGPEHVFTSANRHYLEKLGLRDIVGRRVRDVFPEIEAQGILEILDEVYRTGEPFHATALPMDLEVHGRTTRFYFNLVYQAMRDGDGNVTGILAHVNDVTPQVAANARLERLNAELRAAYDETIEGWARALDLKDADTAGHSKRVTHLAVRLARHLGVIGEDLEHLRRGALLHDIGKMGVRDAILLKEGPLDDEEWRLMQSHTTYATELLEPIAYLRPAIDIPLHHHERWDGSGYPAGLAGEDIPFAARVFAVVDVYDALTSDRPYRRAWPHARAVAHIREQAGRHFDPQVVAAFEESIVPDLPAATAKDDT